MSIRALPASPTYSAGPAFRLVNSPTFTVGPTFRLISPRTLNAQAVRVYDPDPAAGSPERYPYNFPPRHMSDWDAGDVIFDHWQHSLIEACIAKMFRTCPKHLTLTYDEATRIAWDRFYFCAKEGHLRTQRFWCWSWDIYHPDNVRETRVYDPNTAAEETMNIDLHHDVPLTGNLTPSSYITPASSPLEPTPPSSPPYTGKNYLGVDRHPAGPARRFQDDRSPRSPSI
jgi:hypothetical protein